MKANVTFLVGAIFVIGVTEGRGEQEWEPLFDGKTLEGWSTPEPGYWSVVVDGQEGERDAAGALALQLHSGPPMKVQFKEIRVRRL